jgi:malate synthase
MASNGLELRKGVSTAYGDVLTSRALAAIAALVPLDADRKAVMAARIARRGQRARDHQRIAFLDAASTIPRTSITVGDAREGRFSGSAIPADLRRQWVQGTGPAARPSVPIDRSIRNIAYALLSGADGWMFDGEDALGQVASMSLDNQRNLRLAVHRDPVFMGAAQQLADEVNQWALGFLGHRTVDDWTDQIGFTTKIFRPRGLHLEDRHLRHEGGAGLSASIVDVALYVVSNHERLLSEGSSLVLYLPKIQTAEEAALWEDLLTTLEEHLGLAVGTIKTYVLVEQLEAAFQLMEIRAALGLHFVGFNTGRWDYINSVSDAMAWDASFVNPNIDVITMTYPYMRAYEDRVRRAVNTPDALGQYALWQGGMEPNIPVGSEAGVKAGMERAMAGARREQAEGASGKWVAHWKMVHIVRPVWETVGEDNQQGRAFPRLTYMGQDAASLTALEPNPRTIRGARDLLSVGLQYGNAFGQGMQAAALKPADSFGNDDVLYLMEDMATGEIRLSILWEWLHKGATLTADAPEVGASAGDRFTSDLLLRLIEEEYQKLLSADDRDVFESSKETTLPIAREIVRAYLLEPTKLPWYIDLLNANLDNHDLAKAVERIRHLAEAFRLSGTRVTENLDFTPTT